MSTLFASCSTKSGNYDYSLSKFKSVPSKVKYKKDPVQWMFWDEGQDLTSAEKIINSLRSIDSTVAKIAGDPNRIGIQDAKTQLQDMAKSRMKDEVLLRNIIYRLTNIDLLSKQPQKALKRLSLYFDQKQLKTHLLSAEESLFLAFVYGSAGNYFQSIAWFDNCRNIAKRGGIGYEVPISEKATDGLKSVIRSIPNEQFEGLAERFSENNYLSALFGKERFARQEGGKKVSGNIFDDGEAYIGDKNVNSEKATVAYDGSHIVGLLPLSGRFADLGLSVKRGIELRSRKGVKNISFVDSEQKISSVLSSLGNMQARSDQPLFVIGPLLNRLVKPIVTELKKSKTSAIVLARDKDINLGDGIYRLAYTIERQAEAIVNHSKNYRVERSYVIVDDSTRQLRIDIRKMESEFRTPSEIIIVNLKDNATCDVAAKRINESSGSARLMMLATVENMSRVMERLSASKRAELDMYGIGQGWFNAERLRPFGELFTGVKVAAPFWANSNNQWFIEEYRSRYGVEPDFLAALGHDAALVASNLANGNSTPMQGVTGLVYPGNFDIGTDYQIVRYNGSGFE